MISPLAAPFAAGRKGFDLYRWASGVVASYSFILGDDQYQGMVAVWDFVNHHGSGRCNVRLHHCSKGGVLQMHATKDIRKGEEVYNTYGALSNSELLRGYGFVEQDNINSHAQVPSVFVMKAVSNVMQQQSVVASAQPGRARGIKCRMTFCKHHSLTPANPVFKVYSPLEQHEKLLKRQQRRLHANGPTKCTGLAPQAFLHNISNKDSPALSDTPHHPAYKGNQLQAHPCGKIMSLGSQRVMVCVVVSVKCALATFIRVRNVTNSHATDRLMIRLRVFQGCSQCNVDIYVIYGLPSLLLLTAPVALHVMRILAGSQPKVLPASPELTETIRNLLISDGFCPLGKVLQLPSGPKNPNCQQKLCRR